MDPDEYVMPTEVLRGAVKPASVSATATQHRLYSRCGRPISWFFRLIAPTTRACDISEGAVLDEKRAVALLETTPHDASSPSVIVSIETVLPAREPRSPNRLFAMFDTPSHLFVWLGDIAPALRTCYELMTESAARKPYFDIDFSKELVASSGLDFQTVAAEVRKIAAEAARTAGVPRATAAVYSSAREGVSEKFSFHIVVQGVVLETADEARIYATMTRDTCAARGVDARVVSAIDFGVYSKTQQFRMLGCRKHGQPDDRVKRFAPELSSFALVPNTPQPGFALFKYALLTETAGCIPPGGRFAAEVERAAQARTAADRERRIAIDEARLRAIANGADHLADFDPFAAAVRAVDEMRKSFKRLNFGFPFRMRDACGDYDYNEDWSFIVSLIREAPSLCPGCNRVHEAENPFITVSPLGQNASFYCRRSQGAGFTVSLMDHMPGASAPAAAPAAAPAPPPRGSPAKPAEAAAKPADTETKAAVDKPSRKTAAFRKRVAQASVLLPKDFQKDYTDKVVAQRGKIYFRRPVAVAAF
jgi:hypothetical protein